ncbi:hypothetical protein MASR2M48_01990 [Spirochaetota bacterium]
MTPILVQDGSFDSFGVRPLFTAAAQSLKPRLYEFVLEKLDDYEGRARRKSPVKTM